MQKIYVLLRNDQQTGPYSLEEITQFDLKPYDLIWIEGKSAGWYYPQEIAALHSYLPFLPQKQKPITQTTAAPEEKGFVALPVPPKQEDPPVVQPVHEAPQVTQPVYETAYVPAKAAKHLSSTAKNFEEEIYAQFIKPETETDSPVATPVATKKKSSNRSVGVAIATILVVGGVFAASWVMNRHSDEDEAATETVAATPAQTEVPNSTIAANDNTQSKQTTSATKQKKEKNIAATKQKATVVKRPSLPKADQKISANNSDGQAATDDATAPAKEESEAPVITKEPSSTTPAETTPAPQEKKKKLRDKIFDIFRKEPDEQKSDEAKPADTENGERRSTRREDGADLAQMVSIRFDVPNDWMMGIKGAKATLVNRSGEAVGKAVVEVLYYDDDNNLLQKKTITFSNVDGKGSKTTSIPDHSTATKVDYNIVSVTGKAGA